MASDQGDTVEAGELAVAANCSVFYGANWALFVLAGKVSTI
jgi:hypothetical protein